MKTILITGGAGFLGSHLAEKLIAMDHKVIVIDNLHTGTYENIINLESHENFIFFNHDITEPINLNHDVDEIYNLACPASPIHYQSDPLKTVQTNVFGAFNVSSFALTKGSKILQASTSEIYGDPKISPQDESYWGNVNTIGLRSCYDEGKRCAETIFSDFKRQHALDTRIVRIFNTYGPRMQINDGRVVSNFIIQALRNENITIYGDGSQTRSFCFYADLVDAFISVMELQKLDGPINLGNPVEFTIKELAEMVIKKVNTNSKIVYCELPEDDPKQRKPDIAKANSLLGWKPTFQLNEGLDLTIKYFKDKL